MTNQQLTTRELPEELESIRGLEDRFAIAVRQRELLENYIKERLTPGKHFYKVQGSKNSLTKEGAELICLPHGYKPSYSFDAGPSQPPEDGSPYQLTVKCRLMKGQSFAGEGIGSASSHVTKKDGERIPRQPDIGLRHNATLKMAQKCLGSTTPLLIKTKHGISRTTLGKLWLFARSATEPVWIPSPSGGWVKVLAMARLFHKPVKTIILADGSRIIATPEHRFPTSGGLKAVIDLQPGDVLCRHAIDLGVNNGVLPHIAWTAGLFLAEGGSTTNQRGDGHYTRFALHQKESHYARRVDAAAHLVGVGARITPKKNSLGMTVTVSGPAFAGLMRQFVTGASAHTKHFATAAWRQGPHFLEEALQGYLDGDGSRDDRQGHKQNKWLVGFSGRNAELANDLRSVCAVLGYRLNLHSSFATCQTGTLPVWHGWISKSKPAYNGKNLNTVVSITNHKPSTVYDLQVEASDHLFLLANGIATHNSAYIAATLNATAASEFFTQDIEDGAEVAESKAAPKDNRFYCSEHEISWTKHTSQDGKSTWYSHKQGDGWCNMKEARLKEAPLDAKDKQDQPSLSTGFAVHMASQAAEIASRHAGKDITAVEWQTLYTWAAEKHGINTPDGVHMILGKPPAEWTGTLRDAAALIQAAKKG